MSLLTDARVFSKNQRRISLPGDASYRGLSHSRKTQFLAKLSDCVIHNSSQYEVKYATVLQSTLINSSHIFIVIAQTYATLFQVIVTIEHCHCNLYSGLSQMQFQKSQEQYQKIPKSVVVQQKIGGPWYVLKIEPNMILKINWHDSFYIFSNFKISFIQVKSFLLLYSFAWCKNCYWRAVDNEAAEIHAWCKWRIILFDVIFCVFMSAVWFKILSRIDISMKDIQPRQATLDTEVTNIQKLLKDLNWIAKQLASCVEWSNLSFALRLSSLLEEV